MSVSTDPGKSDINTVFGRCRCCFEYGYMKNMWTAYYSAGEKEVYGEMIMETFSIAWESAEDSKAHICETCVQRLRDARGFKRVVLRAARHLDDNEDQEYEMEEEDPDDIWFKLKYGDGEGSEASQEYEELPPEDVKVEPVEYEEVEYLEEYAPVIEENTNEPEEAERPPRVCRRKNSKGEEVIRPYKNYSTAVMRKAVEAVRSGELSVADAARAFNVPKKTVAAKMQALKNNPQGEQAETTKAIAREAIKVKLYKYLGGDDVHKHRENVCEIFKWSNATPLTRHGKGGFGCYFCKSSFKRAKQLKAHSISTHKHSLEKLHTKHTLQWTIRIDITDLKCKICDAEMTKIEDLLEHLKTHDKVVHTDVKNQIIPYSFPNNVFTCMVCNKTFEAFKNITDHMIEHYKIYECDDCGKGFVSKKNLSRHVSRHKMGEHRCAYCKKEFANRELMLSHERLMHKRPDRRRKVPEGLDCHICCKKFPSNLQLSRHINKTHLKESRYHCEHCDKGFFVKYEMEDHMLVHSNERKYKCTICPKAFTWRRGLVEHLRIHSGDKSYRCELCGERFVRAQAKRLHKIKKHGMAKRSIISPSMK